MATRHYAVEEGPGRSPKNKSQRSEIRNPRWLTCPADEFIYKWLPRFESGELQYKGTDTATCAPTGGDE